MKYNDLINFEPINEVVKFDRLRDDDYRKSLVRNFVFSDTYEKVIIPEVSKNLDYTASYDTFGLQIVGNYGTGKSHLMSLVSLIAEDAELLPLVHNDGARKVLGNIAGKYKVIRFELGSDDELWRIVCYQIDLRLKEWGIDYSILGDTTPDSYGDKLNRLMAHFEKQFPDKGLMIVIDEMLSYLKGRATGDRLNRDLQVLQALGQKSDHTKLRMIFGVQELIYNTPQFQFAANMLGRVNDRYRQITITKQDVQFVVQQRLLRKDERQKAIISKHLGKFTEFFTDMHAHFDDYVNLFPVNPSFFENFQQIKVEKSQREVLKTLSGKFQQMQNLDVPENEPGLICYDHYWDDLDVPNMKTDPDVRRVSDIMSVIRQKIDENFTGARAKNAPLAHRIANACAVKILQDDLQKTNGVNTESLVDDLCYMDASILNRDFLMDIFSTTAQQIISATAGQYFEKNEQNQEYHLRVEGGVNYEQKIKDYIPTMDADRKDAHFFNFLVEFLPIETEQYKREFKIFAHRVEWKSHKTMLDGYIFMGNPNERSTAQPEQNFYIYFMPLFNEKKMNHGDEPDSVYIHTNKYSQEMRDLLEFYAAAEELKAGVDSSQKVFYEQFRKQYEKKLLDVFQRDFAEKTEVYYQGELQSVSPAMMTGGSKEEIVSNIASTLLEEYFCQQKPDYPKFTLLRATLTSDNRATILKSARQRIAMPTTPNRDGEAILHGLGLLQDAQLSVDACQYVLSVLQMLENKGTGQVLNRDEILYRFFKEWEDDWRSRDFDLEADLEFLVLATMVAMGKIEISLPGGKNINAANIREIVDLPRETFYSFSHICQPRNMNVEAVRELFIGITGKDLTSQMEKMEIYAELVAEAKQLAANAVEIGHKVANGIFLENIEILSSSDGSKIRNRLQALSGLCDKIGSYASPAKMRNLPWTADEIKKIVSAKKDINEVKKLTKFVDDFRSRLSYLTQAQQYMTSEEMKTRISATLKKINEVIGHKDNEQYVSVYRAELDALMGDYADWYLKEYQRLHITGLQDTEKRRIVNSNENHICEVVLSSDSGYFSVAQQYNDWTRKMSALTVASTSVTRDSILRTPYQGFNPKQYEGKSLPSIASLGDELNKIYESVDQSLHQLLKDEALLKNKDILETGEQQLLDRFNSGSEGLSTTNAERLIEIVGKLHKGITRIDLTMANLRTFLNRPMTVEEARKAFASCLRSLTGGSADENIRITLK